MKKSPRTSRGRCPGKRGRMATLTRDVQYGNVSRHRCVITFVSYMRSCRAPIASLDCMEEFNGGGGGGGGGGGADSGVHCSNTTGTKEQLLTSCIAAQAQRLQHPSPGIRYRNLGKSGLRVSNVGLGTPNVFPFFNRREPSSPRPPPLSARTLPPSSKAIYIYIYIYVP